MNINPIIFTRLFKKYKNILEVNGKDIPTATKINYEELKNITNKRFDLVVCRNLVENMKNPQFLLNELSRVANDGYIETISPLR